jgi:hypothetical protein
MTLAQIAQGNASLPLTALAKPANVTLTKEIQANLTRLGCLDPKPDGAFGPISRLALIRFAGVKQLHFAEAVSPQIASALLRERPETFIPLRLGGDFASRMVRYMQLKGMFVAKLPNYLNIVYVEGADANGRPNADTFNVFNDRRTVFHIDGAGRPVLDLNVLATTEPGKFFTDHPLNPDGAARIAFGQYKAWHVGQHHPELSPPRRHEALVQAGNVSIFRDKNKDGIRPGDRQFTVGPAAGVNQHSGLDQSPSNIGKISAGCLVGQASAEHRAFMTLVKKDPRFAANHGYVYMTAVLAGDDLAAKVP